MCSCIQFPRQFSTESGPKQRRIVPPGLEKQHQSDLKLSQRDQSLSAIMVAQFRNHSNHRSTMVLSPQLNKGETLASRTAKVTIPNLVFHKRTMGTMAPECNFVYQPSERLAPLSIMGEHFPPLCGPNRDHFPFKPLGTILSLRLEGFHMGPQLTVGGPYN